MRLFPAVVGLLHTQAISAKSPETTRVAAMRAICSLRGGFQVLLLCLPGYGQIDTGTISGVVRDSAGAVVPEAKVSIANEATGQKVALLSNESGLFFSGPLRPESYVVEVEAKGFSKSAATRRRI